MLNFPIPKRKPSVIKRFRNTMPTGEVTQTVWDVYRIFGNSKQHMRAYQGYADFDYAERIKDELQSKCGDKCYLVGRQVRRLKRNGTKR